MVLAWRITNNDTPHKTARPYWLYIHEIFDSGVADEGYNYPKCAIQRTDLYVPTPPFEITKDVEAAFRRAVQDEDIARYLIQRDRDVFSLDYSLDGIPPLINRMRKYMGI